MSKWFYFFVQYGIFKIINNIRRNTMFIEKFKVYCKEDNNDSCEIFTSLKEAEEKAAELNKNSNKTYVIESFFENEGF